MALVSEESAEIVKQRGAVYGDPRPNHIRIAALWSVVFAHPVTPQQVAQCMRLVKESRLIETPGHRDSLVDLCGYADVEDVICNGHHDTRQAVEAAICPSVDGGQGQGRMLRRPEGKGEGNPDRSVSEK
jgi:hypothetical protein